MDHFYAYLDTNTFLHFRSFDEIDWCKLLETKNVTLVVCSTVIKELDDKKNIAKDDKIRERAKNVLSKVESFVLGTNGIAIKDNVQLLYATNEPKIDWNASGLDFSIANDRIIATILCQTYQNKEQSILITNDTGLRLKARAKGIKYYRLPEELRLPLVKSEEEKEIIKLKRELEKYRNKIPELSLALFTQQGPTELIKFTLQGIGNFNATEAKARAQTIGKRLAYNEKTPEGIIKFNQPSENEIARYKHDLEVYIKEYEKFLGDTWKYETFRARTVEITFILLNKGNCPGEDIDVFCHLPDGLEVFEKNDLPEEPSAPSKPERPLTATERMIKSLEFSPTLLSTHIPYRLPEVNIHEGKPHIKRTKSYDVEYHLTRLKHNLEHKFDPIFIIYSDFENIFSFKVQYRIIASNVPEPIEGTLNVVTKLE